MSDWVRAGAAADFQPGEVVGLEIGEHEVALANVDGTFYAISDVCSHEYVLLHDGYLDDCELECPQHGSLFDVRTGEVMNPPATKAVPVFEVRVEDGDVFINPQPKTNTKES